MTRDEQAVLMERLDSFLDDSVILEVLEVVQSGKEATVFRCRAAPLTGEAFFAAKVYRPLESRNFRNDSVYQQGRVILNHRTRRAYQNKTGFGRKVQYGRWVAAEYETQQMLHESGADVPRPVACNGSAILMEWLGDGLAAATQLRHAPVTREEAPRLFERLMGNIELMLRNNRIHGDLSPFNILYWRGHLTIIDFPQAVDPRENRSAHDLLRRDLENVCRYFERLGVRANAHRIAGQLWARFLRAEL
jgi:RIO kinase 1